MKENSIEEALEKLSNGKKIKMYELLRTFKREGIENFVITRKKYVDVILSDYKRVLKENEELKKFHIQDNKHLDFIMQHSIPIQKVKDKIEGLKINLVNMQGEELLIYESKIDVLQELLEGRK